MNCYDSYEACEPFKAWYFLLFFFCLTFVLFPGESVSVRETMRGKNNESVLMFELYLEGKMPVLGSEKFIKLKDYVHTYRYDKLGVLRGYYDTSFNVGTKKFKMDVGEVLQFDEVEDCENIKSSKMIVSDVRVFYDRRKMLVNFAIKAKMEENGK